MKSHLAPLHHSPFLNPPVSKFKLLLSRISNARAVLPGLVVGLASSATIVSRPQHRSPTRKCWQMEHPARV